MGDRESYLEKFKICARVRLKGSKKLGSKFHSGEHTRPLFDEHNLLAVRNLYHYFFTIIDVLKILKIRAPITLYKLYTLSNRESSRTSLIPPSGHHNFSIEVP